MGRLSQIEALSSVQRVHRDDERANSDESTKAAFFPEISDSKGLAIPPYDRRGADRLVDRQSFSPHATAYDAADPRRATAYDAADPRRATAAYDAADPRRATAAYDAADPRAAAAITADASRSVATLIARDAALGTAESQAVRDTFPQAVGFDRKKTEEAAAGMEKEARSTRKSPEAKDKPSERLLREKLSDLQGERARRERGRADGSAAQSAEIQKVVSALKARDAEVRGHESAHISAGGRYVTGGASYSYQKGPDGRHYAIGGEVGIDSSPVPGKPEETAAKMRIVRAAALAPAEPSGADMAVAGAASQAEGQALSEISAARREELVGRYASESQSSPEEKAKVSRNASTEWAASSGSAAKEGAAKEGEAQEGEAQEGAAAKDTASAAEAPAGRWAEASRGVFSGADSKPEASELERNVRGDKNLLPGSLIDLVA